jgi:hypothetical protein
VIWASLFGSVGFGICGFRNDATMAGSCTKIFSYATNFYFMPAAVRFGLTVFSTVSPSSQCLMSSVNDIGTRSSVDFRSAARLSITWRGARRNVNTTPMPCHGSSERAPQPMQSLNCSIIDSRAKRLAVASTHLVRRIPARRRIRMGRLLAGYTGYLGLATILLSHDLTAADADQRLPQLLVGLLDASGL